MISDERTEKAVEYIRDNADDLAYARAQAKFLDHERKVIRATHIADKTGTVLDRESYAETQEDYLECLEKMRDAVYKSELIATKIKAAELTIEVWRTQQASSRKGHL